MRPAQTHLARWGQAGSSFRSRSVTVQQAPSAASSSATRHWLKHQQRDDDGHALVVRNREAHTRRVKLGAGTVEGRMARLGGSVRTVMLYYSHWIPREDRSRAAVSARAG